DDGFLLFPGIFQFLLQGSLVLCLQLIYIFTVYYAFLYQGLGVNIPWVFVLGNGFVQFWLGKPRLIPFVMPVLSVSQKVKKNVTPIAHSVLQGKKGCVDHSLGIIRINM